MKVPFGDLKRQYNQIQDVINAATKSVYESGWFVLGTQVRAFEESFSRYCQAEFTVGVGSGTEALHLALLACGLQLGDEVITVANTCVPTISAISFAGGVPVFVDVDPHTFTIEPSKIEERISPKTKVILPVHLYGQCADMDPILEIATRYGLAVVEDCAQAHGAQYKGRIAGTMGNAAAFSFYPSKNLGAYGDGGAVVTKDAKLASTVEKLRNYGQEQRYYHSIKGFNSRLDELQAAILIAKLPYLEQWNKKRREIASRYNQAFQAEGIFCPLEATQQFHVYHLYVIRVPKRQEFQQFLSEQGVATLIHYPVPVHQQLAYSEHEFQSVYLPITEKIATEIVSLPLYPELTDDEVSYVIDTVIKGYQKFNL